MCEQSGETERKSLPKLRFSMSSFALLFTLTAVAVSHWATCRRLSESQREIKRLAGSYGALVVSDPKLLHVMSGSGTLVHDDGFNSLLPETDPNDFEWQIYFPPEEKWRLCWSFGTVPKSGVSAMKSGSQDLPTLNGIGELQLVATSDVIYFYLREPGYQPVMHFEAKIEDTCRQWLEHSHKNREARSGEIGRRRLTQAFPANQPAILLRKYRETSLHDNVGITVWLEPIRGSELPN